MSLRIDAAVLESRWARAYDAYATSRDVELLGAVLPPPPVAVLDIPCGHGRLVAWLVDAGYQVTGLDIAESSTTATRARVSSADVIRGDMAALPLGPRSFDVAICMGNSLIFTDDATTATFFESVARSLRPAGLFILQTGHRDSLVRAERGPRSDTSADGWTTEYAESFDPVTGVREITRTHTAPDGATASETTRLRVYTITELTTLLRTAGFTPERWLEGPSLIPPTIDSPGVTMVSAVA